MCAIQALGCVVIEMGSGKDPWSEKNFKNIYQTIFHIANTTDIPLIPGHFSSECQDFCRRCLIRDPDLRPSATQLLNHPFICGSDARSKQK